MNKLSIVLASLTLSLSANAALYDRGNGMIYDDVLDITWLQDANYAQTSGYDSDGRMTWADAKAWADQLVYEGYDDWRLASANLMIGHGCYTYDGSCDTGFNNTTGDLGHMFYNNLGNLGRYDTSRNSQSGYGVTNSSFTDSDSGSTVSILNFQNAVYWLDEESDLDNGIAWIFRANTGYQGSGDKRANYYSWAVRDGDVSTVPVPATLWLFGSALLGLVGVKRRN